MAALAWYKQKFGGDTGKLKDRIDGLTYGGVWLLVAKGEATPSDGHAIDHIGWRTPNLAAKASELKAQSVKFTTEPRPLTLASASLLLVGIAALASWIPARRTSRVDPADVLRAE